MDPGKNKSRQGEDVRQNYANSAYSDLDHQIRRTVEEVGTVAALRLLLDFADDLVGDIEGSK